MGRSSLLYEEIDHLQNAEALVKKDGRWGNLIEGEIDYDAERKIFYKPEIAPAFKGCEQYDSANLSSPDECTGKKVIKKVYGHIIYPPLARENGIEGLVVISFLISPEGKVTDPKILRDLGAGCGEEALRVVKLLPDWLPAKQEGENVWSILNLPVRFRLE